jgi:hypothetical protein
VPSRLSASATSAGSVSTRLGPSTVGAGSHAAASSESADGVYVSSSRSAGCTAPAGVVGVVGVAIGSRALPSSRQPASIAGTRSEKPRVFIVVFVMPR